MSLLNQLKIGSSVVVVNTTEPFRVLDEVVNNTTKPVFRFGFQDKLTRWDPKRQGWFFSLFDLPNEDDKVTVSMSEHIMLVLQHVRELNGILIFTDVNSVAKPLGNIFFEYCLSFRTAVMKDDASQYRHQIICVTNDMKELPPFFLQAVQVVELDLPTATDISGYIEHLTSTLDGVTVSQQEKDLIAQSGKGLTEKDFYSIALNEVTESGGITSMNVFNKKRELLKANDILDISKPKIKLSEIGGLDLVKDIITKLAWMWDNPDTVKDLNIDPISKVLLVGVSGSGKSAICQAAADAMNLEVAKGGVSQSLSKWVGESLPYDEKLLVRINGNATRIAIGELVESGDLNLDTIEAWTHTNDGKAAFLPVTGLISHTSPGYIDVITTESGRTVKVTGGHSLFTRSANNTLEDIIADDIEEGKTRVAVALRNYVAGNISQIRVSDYLDQTNFRDEFPEMVELTQDFCEFLGWYAAEGDINLTAVRLTINDKLADYVLALCKRLFNNVSTYQQQGALSIRINSKTLVALFGALGIKTGSHNKNVPDFMLDTNEVNIGAYLRGYFSGDGYINQNGKSIEVTSVSQELIKGIDTLLSMVGIRPRLRVRKVKGYGDTYRLRIGWSQYLQRYLEIIGNADDDKNKMVIEYLDGITLNRYLQTPEPHIVNDVVFETVVSVVREVDNHPHVYDISVEGTERFIAGDNILVHNSEQNMRRTFKTLGAIAPVLFWIDEFGRDMGGGGTANDSGTSDRVLGEFLTGLQELPNDVFLFAAANKIDALPPEMTRSGRFDVIMFVGFPTIAERIEIFSMKLGTHAKNHDLKRLAEATELFTGAEIEATIKEARFHVGTSAEHRSPSTDEIVAAAKALKNRVWVNKNPEIIEMYKRAKTEWKWASSKQEHEADDILARATRTIHPINKKPALTAEKPLGASTTARRDW